MSGALLRRLGHPEGYGMAYPWTKALWLLRVECRRKHPHHRSGDRPYWRGALCHQAVRLVVVGGDAGGGPMPPYAAGKVLRVDRMAPLLVGGFRFIEQTIDDFRERAERREREDTGRFSISESAVPEHRPLDGLHRIDCPQCRKHAA